MAEAVGGPHALPKAAALRPEGETAPVPAPRPEDEH